MHPCARSIDIDSEARIPQHRKMIEAKPLLKAVYEKHYQEFVPAFEETRLLPGKIVEIGCGASFLEEYISDLEKTDSLPNPYAHRVVDAMNMDYSDGSVRAFFMLGVLHHLHEPARFLKEAMRCLTVGGRVVMVEPHNSFLQRFLCKLMNHYEYFDDAIEEWKNLDSGNMSNANLALPWVIFVRDQKKFASEFPNLSIKEIRYHTFSSYIVSGGMTYRSFLPGCAKPAVNTLEAILKPWMTKFGTTMTIDLVKTNIN